MLSVERFTDPGPFLDAVGLFLAEREAEHNLLFGISANLSLDPGGSAGPPYLAAVTRGASVVGAALMTPPHNLVLSCMDDPAAPSALAVHLAADGSPLPGVTAPIDIARTFAEEWAAAHGLTARRTIAERIYRTQRVVPPTGVHGRARLATAADRAILITFTRAFLREALDRSGDDAGDFVDGALRSGTRQFHLWDDGGPVSLVGVGGRTPNGIRIGPVFTPPDRRGHGYASALTAFVTQAQFDEGRRFVFLFTDIANATSNKIYQAIGYEPVIDIDQWTFEVAT